MKGLEYEECRLSKLLTLGLLYLSLSCTKTNTADRIEKIQENTWGIDHKSQTVADSPDIIKSKISKAVVAIYDVGNGSGTGFFVSPDGLLLTNAHVMEENIGCSREECSNGRFFIRNFTPDGEMEKFTKFKVQALNWALDFALIKIELPAGEEVPFLDLDAEIKSFLDLKNMDLRIVGHLGGSQLRVSPARIESVEESYYRLFSSATNGDSGSPLIDVASGKVVGLYHSSDWDKEWVRKDNGGVMHFGFASHLDLILNALAVGFGQKDLSQGGGNLEATPDFLPLSKKSLFEKYPFSPAVLFTQALGKPGSDEAALKWITHLSRYPHVPHEKISALLNALVEMELRTNKSLITTANNATDFLNIAVSMKRGEGEEAFDQFKIRYGMKTSKECVEAIGKTEGTINLAKLELYGRRCLSVVDADGIDIIARLNSLIQNGEVKVDEYNARSNVFLILNQQLLLRESLSADNLNIAKDLYRKLYANEVFVLDAARFERQFLMLDRMPSLLLKGGFKETIN